MVSDEKIKNLMERSVVDVIEKDNLEKKLKEGKKLRIKLGIDPTGPKLHLGRAVALWKLRQFQDLGHQVVLIIGDFTGLVGDASDKESARSQLSKSDLEENMKDYKNQIGKILDIKKTEFRYNSEWLGKLKFEDIMRLASLFTIRQLINRRNFKERFESEQIIGFQEFLYPLMQGYDSVAVEADVEIGGTDQLFNLMAGRKIQEFYEQNAQNIMTLKMLEGLDGKKMSTSQGNVINIADESVDMFGKVMSMKDDLIVPYLKLTTFLPLKDIEKIEKGLKTGNLNPFETKKDLAFDLVKIYCNEKKAQKAKDSFEKVFQKGELPENVPLIKIKKDEKLADMLLREKIVDSKTIFRRFIKDGAIEINGIIIDNVHQKINKSGVVRIGKKKFIKVKIN